jgi:two-component system, LytTR family, response regulator
MGDLVFLDLDPYPSSRTRATRRLAIDDRIMLPVDHAWKLVKLRTIELIYAAGDYSEVHLADSTHLLTLRSLRCWENCLPERQFVRVHRSAIVNADAIERLEEWFNSSFRIHLRNRPDPLISSRRYATQLRSRFR